MRISLRTLLILLAVGPPLLALSLVAWDAVIMPLIWRFVYWPPL
jgi:hypothetical protein